MERKRERKKERKRAVVSAVYVFNFLIKNVVFVVCSLSVPIILEGTINPKSSNHTYACHPEPEWCPHEIPDMILKRVQLLFCVTQCLQPLDMVNIDSCIENEHDRKCTDLVLIVRSGVDTHQNNECIYQASHHLPRNKRG